MMLSEIQNFYSERLLKLIAITFFVYTVLPVKILAFGPSSCAVIQNNNLSQQVDYDFDSRLDGLTTASGTINQWTTRGNGIGGWVRNSQAWTQNGDQPIDWTGVSPWNSADGYNKAGVLISPKHIAFARHYQMATGTTVIFVDLEGNVVSRTITKTVSLSADDITIGELNSEVPNTIAYYPTIDPVAFEKKLHITNLPLVAFDQEDHLIVAEQNAYTFPRAYQWFESKGLSMSFPEKSNRGLFNEEIDGGDSGNPMFTIINNQPVLLSTMTGGGAGGGPLYPAYIDEINAAISSLNSTSTISEYDISCWGDVPDSITVNSTHFVELDIASAQNGDVVTAFSSQNIRTSAYTNVTYTIVSGNDLGAFTIENQTKSIACAGIQNCIYTDGKLKIQNKSALVAGTQYDLVLRSATSTNNGLLTRDFTVRVAVASSTPVVSSYVWSTKSALSNTSKVSLSSDGAKMIAIKDANDYIYKSIDFGENWSPILTSSLLDWQDIAISATGTDIYAGSTNPNNYLYISHNGGQNWSTATSLGELPWRFIDTTSDGSHIVTMPYLTTKPAYISNDYGLNWADVPEFGKTSFWNGIAVSNNGQTVVSASSFINLPLAGYIYLSKDGGKTWNILIDQTKTFRSAVDVSGDGRTIVAAEEERYIHISKDSGDTWSIITKTGQQSWASLAISDDGLVIAATTQTGKVFYSQDGGDNWLINSGSEGQYGTRVTVSRDGSTIVQSGPTMATRIARPYPSVSGINSAVTSSSAVVTWQTNIQTNSYLEYGLTSAYTASSTSNVSTTTSHSTSIAGLTAGSLYHYRIISIDQLGNIATTTDQTFRTTESAVPQSGGGGGGGGGSYSPAVATAGITANTTDVIGKKTEKQPNNILNQSISLIAIINNLSVNQRDLQINTKGNDVKTLQQFLNYQGFIVSKAGAGSTGKETLLFGPATKAALAKFQLKNKILPATGYFGPKTKAFIKSLSNKN